MKPASTLAAALAVALITLAGTNALAQHSGAPAVPGQKLDSGLGELPPYAQWDDPTGRQPVRHRVAGESLDDGLGELPHYSRWRDPSGRNPTGNITVGLAQR